MAGVATKTHRSLDGYDPDDEGEGDPPCCANNDGRASPLPIYTFSSLSGRKTRLMALQFRGGAMRPIFHHRRGGHLFPQRRQKGQTNDAFRAQSPTLLNRHACSQELRIRIPHSSRGIRKRTPISLASSRFLAMQIKVDPILAHGPAVLRKCRNWATSWHAESIASGAK